MKNGMLTEEEFNRLNSLTEEEFAVESNNLSEEDFYELVKRKGTMTLDEVIEYGKKIIRKMWNLDDDCDF